LSGGGTLPFGPPLEVMLGLLADDLPEGPEWSYEPKWDGFRVLVFRDGDHLELSSRDSRPLLRFFPEVGEALRAALPEAAVVDGEVVVARGGALDFEALQLRLHPAASRVQRLSAELPAAFVAWDLLALGATDLRDPPAPGAPRAAPRRAHRGRAGCGSRRGPPTWRWRGTGSRGSKARVSTA
jgi:ATP-dependent DNA ligase